MGREELMHVVKKGTYSHDVRNAFRQEYLNQDKEWFDYKLLMAAICRGHKSIINFLLDKNVRVRREATTDSFHTPLYYAVLLKDMNIVKKLMKKGASIKDKHFTDQTPICLAISKECFHLADIMLNLANFEDIDPTNVDDIAHFQIACMMEKLDVVEKFVEHGFSLKTASVLNDEKWKGFTPLHFAIMGSNKITKCQTAKYLINKGADIYTQNSQGQTPLHLAYYNNKYTKMQNSISSAVSSQKRKISNPVDKNGVSLFHIYCMCDEESCIETFIRNKVNIDSSVSADLKDDSGYTALHFAIKNNCSEVVLTLLGQGAQVNKPAKGRLTPLHLACQLNRKKIVDVLLEYQASINAVDDKQRTPIHCAFYAAPRLYELIDLLLSHASQNINSTDSRGLSYFHIASAQNNVAMVKKFIQQGISLDSCINSDDEINSGYSALHLAVDYNCQAVVELLLQHNANVNIATSRKNIRPLHLACNYNNTKFLENKQTYSIKKRRVSYKDCYETRIKIINLLLSNEADINAQIYNGETVLMYALTVSEIPEVIIDTLIGGNPNVHICSNDNSSILHFISKSKLHSPKAVEWSKHFIEIGANVNAVNDTNGTPLHEAIQHECSNVKLIELFFKYGADVNAKTQMLMTPLHLCVKKIDQYSDEADEEACQLLLDNGSDVDAKNYLGKTPLHIAFTNQSCSIIKKLLEHGANINIEDAKGFPTIDPYCQWKTFHYWDPANITEEIEIHLKKLIAIGFSISDKVKECYSILKNDKLEYPNDADDIFIKCSEEIEKLKNVRIDNYTSLYSIIFKDQNEMVNHLNNKALKLMLKDDSLKSKFPLYGYMLKLQFKRGLVRRTYLQPAKASLNFLIGMSLPDSCSESILGYLVNNDLEKLDQAQKLTTSVKRKLNDHISKAVPLKKQRHSD